jgi:nucleotide-binding universal stress UspA family protein
MIPQIKKILYATDLTENSSYAFRYALDLAQWREAKIVILHAIEPLPGSVVRRFGTVGRETEEQRQKETVELIKTRLREFCKNMEVQTGPRCPELISDILVSTGHAAEEILNTADEKECDLIVLGTHGKGFLAHTFLGSVASAVLHRTRKPVLIIPLPSSNAAVNEDGI